MLHIGLMSGTSLDGVDGVLVDFGTGSDLNVRAHVHRALPIALRTELLALNVPGDNELHRSALAANLLARLYAAVAAELLAKGAVGADAVRAVGAHGQTVRHRPGSFDGTGYTIQLLNPALLAELGGIDVVADFRSRDVAAGGQGAPLVPAFHRAVFARPGVTVAVLNLGGIANLTVLDAGGLTLGFDCGPANALMDHWCELHTGKLYDDAGAWGAAGQVVAPLLAKMLADPYFALAPPKSTGRDHFNERWLDRMLAQNSALRSQDVQATLIELTASVCASDLRRHAGGARELLVCGGGALNARLLARLAALLPECRVRTTDAAIGLPAMQVEAAAFAWLAAAHCDRRAGNLPSVTGATGGRVLGALYPAAMPGDDIR
jgi:anhydro-N-acetylmuramic acid kinase